MTYFSYATFWNKIKYFANDSFRNGEYLKLCKNGILDEYKEQNKCNEAECLACNIYITYAKCKKTCLVLIFIFLYQQYAKCKHVRFSVRIISADKKFFFVKNEPAIGNLESLKKIGPGLTFWNEHTMLSYASSHNNKL